MTAILMSNRLYRDVSLYKLSYDLSNVLVKPQSRIPGRHRRKTQRQRLGIEIEATGRSEYGYIMLRERFLHLVAASCHFCFRIGAGAALLYRRVSGLSEG